MYHPELIRHPESCPALVLNADYTPLSYYPLSLWPWQTAIKAMFLERVDVVAHYDREVHSPSIALKLPSVIALRDYVRPNEYPAFTRFNLFLRDRFRCVYCGSAQGADLRPCGAARPGRPHDVGECRHRLRALQPSQGRPHAGRGAHAHPCASRSGRPAGSCRSTGGRSRRITCTRAGAIISIGMSSCCRDPARASSTGRFGIRLPRDRHAGIEPAYARRSRASSEEDAALLTAAPDHSVALAMLFGIAWYRYCGMFACP